MISSFSFHADAPKDIRFHGFSGFSIRGILFHILKSYSAIEASAIHEQKTLSPYSVKPVITHADSNHRIVYGHLPAGTPFRFDITILEDALSTAVKKFVLNAATIHLQNVEVALRGVRVSSLESSSFLEEARPHERYEVYFVTPTFFRGSQIGPRILERLLPRKLRSTKRPTYRYVIMPDPYYMFRGLVRLYRQFGNPSFKYSSYCNWLLEGGMALETFFDIRAHKIYKNPIEWSRGFTGRVIFTLPEDTFDSKMARLTHALLEFGKYSNVGANRTAGFGVIDYRVASRETQEA